MAISPARGQDHGMHMSPCTCGRHGWVFVPDLSLQASLASSLQRAPRVKARSEGCTRESPPTAGLAGEFGLEKKLRPILRWLHRHIIRVEVHPIDFYLWAPSSHWDETGSC